jgi:hypothetical protein
MRKIGLILLALAFAIGLTLPAALPVLAAGPMSGAIWTTDIGGSVNINIYADKMDVYLNGGPSHSGAAGLPDGYYYVKVTEPDGTLLGNSTSTPVHVTDGEFDSPYRLWDIVVKASDQTQGYDSTGNAGGEYKVWISKDPTFPSSQSKTDNFKVEEDGGGGTVEISELHVIKFYDANANGINDDGQLITGWKVRIQDNIDYIRDTPVDIFVDPDDYTVSEFSPVETYWMSTTPTSVNITLEEDDDVTVEFGNLCLGPGGGKTLGFWSNKNGQKTMNDGDTMNPELALLSVLNLRNAAGANFDPANYSAFRTWLLGATATNMAYMLSAQLAAMELNVEAGFVNGSALVYAPGTISANTLGFATVNALMAEANEELETHGTAIAGDAWRSYQECLKNALDNANNNETFVQPTPCPFTFPPDP